MTEMIFGGLMSRHIQSNTRYVVYNGWKMDFCVLVMCMSGNRQ